jgi:hypothetical protein
LSIEIEKTVLEKACKEMIETILLCLPNAFKGTIYRISKPPELIAERITSGIIENGDGRISWGLPANSEYNTPGKPWTEYRDQPGRPLEAMAWCVEKQKSWTSENPKNDTRNLRFQLDGIEEEFHHMEPVLVRKSDLQLDLCPPVEYPTNYQGSRIWSDSDYVVVGVIKIHFQPFTIKIGSHETKVIKKLSRSLGTELLSYQLRQESMRTMERLADDRLSTCNILADSLRNTLTKSGLILSLVKQEIGYLRYQWEQLLMEHQNGKNIKAESIKSLNKLIMSLDEGPEDIKKDLTDAQNKFLELSLPPKKGKNWIMKQIEERWNALLFESSQEDSDKKIIRETIDNLKGSLSFGHDPDIVASCNKIPEALKRELVDLLYKNEDDFNAANLERLIRILENPALVIPSREKSKKTLMKLIALAETMNTLEQSTNFLLGEVLNGGGAKLASNALKNNQNGYSEKHRPFSNGINGNL